jgi:MFS family permease
MFEDQVGLSRVADVRVAGTATALAGFVAVAVAMGIGRFAFTPILPMMQDDSGVSVAAGGWLASANYLGYFLGALAAVGMRASPAVTIRWGLITIGVATLAMGLQDNFAVWLILRTLAGAANAWVAISVFSWCLEQLAPLRRPLLNSLVFAGVGAGIAIAGAICIALMQARVTSAHAWVVFGAVAIVIAIAIWPAFEAATPAPAASAVGRRAATLEWNAERIRLVLCFGAAGYAYIIPATFLPIMARAAIRDPLIFGWSWPIFGAAALGSTLLAAALFERVGNRRLWIWSCLVMAFGVALPVVWPGIAATMIAALCVGGTFMVITMVAMQEAREAGGPHAKKLMAAMTSAFALGQIVGPISVSYIVGRSGNFSGALLLASALLIISAYALSRRPAVVVRA